MKNAMRNFFKMRHEIIPNSILNQPVMNATKDVSNITQSNMHYIVIKINNTIQFHLVQFNIKSSDRQLYHIISMIPNFFNCQN